MDNLLRKEDRPNLKLAADSFKVLALASCQLSQKRKERVATDLEPPYKRLCSASNPVTSFLFGDELPKQVKDIKDAQVVSAKMAKKDDRFRFKGKPGMRSGKHTSGGKFKKPFLGFRAPQHQQSRRRGPPRAQEAQGRPKERSNAQGKGPTRS